MINLDRQTRRIQAKQSEAFKLLKWCLKEQGVWPTYVHLVTDKGRSGVGSLKWFNHIAQRTDFKLPSELLSASFNFSEDKSFKTEIYARYYWSAIVTSLRKAGL